MSVSKKGKRKITVNENLFYWSYKYLDDCMRLIVIPSDKSSRILCDFDGKELSAYFRKLAKDDENYKDILLIITPGIFTPYVVRQVIDYAFANGWTPFGKKRDDFLISGIEHEIDINFWTESTSETRKSALKQANI